VHPLLARSLPAAACTCRLPPRLRSRWRRAAGPPGRRPPEPAACRPGSHANRVRAGGRRRPPRTAAA